VKPGHGPSFHLRWHRRRHADDYAKALAAAVHHIVADGMSPEQAADQAIARLKQLLSE
jgi:hypothetical protein